MDELRPCISPKMREEILIGPKCAQATHGLTGWNTTLHYTNSQWWKVIGLQPRDNRDN
jgi:hypothetical protein